MASQVCVCVSCTVHKAMQSVESYLSLSLFRPHAPHQLGLRHILGARAVKSYIVECAKDTFKVGSIQSLAFSFMHLCF